MIKKATYPRTLDGDCQRNNDNEHQRPRSLDHEERLVEKPPDNPERGKDKDTEDAVCRDARGLFLLSQDRKPKDDVIVDPQCSVNGGADEHPPSGPPMYVVELLVSMARAKKQREDRVLRRK